MQRVALRRSVDQITINRLATGERSSKFRAGIVEISLRADDIVGSNRIKQVRITRFCFEFSIIMSKKKKKKTVLSSRLSNPNDYWIRLVFLSIESWLDTNRKGCHDREISHAEKRDGRRKLRKLSLLLASNRTDACTRNKESLSRAFQLFTGHSNFLRRVRDTFPLKTLRKNSRGRSASLLHVSRIANTTP